MSFSNRVRIWLRKKHCVKSWRNIQAGLLTAAKDGKQKRYAISQHSADLDSWQLAIAFYAEAAPLGVIGRNFQSEAAPFAFKHHFLQGTLDSEVMLQLLLACGERRSVQLVLNDDRDPETVYPVRIYSSVQSGRQYLLQVQLPQRRVMMHRLDHIHRVLTAQTPEQDNEELEVLAAAHEKSMWGAACQGSGHDRVELLIEAGPGEPFVERRLLRECRCGQVECVNETTLRFTAEVIDAAELLPWVRSFTGRIKHFACSNAAVAERWRQDLLAAAALYGGDDNA